MRQLAGEPVSAIRTRAPGNDQPFGGIKVETEAGWFAARPSGTEDVYKIYAESFRDQNHLKTIQQDAQRADRQSFLTPRLSDSRRAAAATESTGDLTDSGEKSRRLGVVLRAGSMK